MGATAKPARSWWASSAAWRHRLFCAKPDSSQPKPIRPANGVSAGHGRNHHPRADRSPQPAERELEDSLRVRTQITPRSDKRRETPRRPRAPERHTSARKRLRHVAVILHPELEHALAPVPCDAKAPELQPSDDGAGSADDQDDPEPNPHGNASADGRTGGQQHQSVMVSGLRTPRHRRRDDERRRRFRRQRKVFRPYLQPCRCGACAAGADDPRPAAQGEREAGSRNVDEETLRSRVRQPNGRARGPREDDARWSCRQRHRRPPRICARRDEREREKHEPKTCRRRRDHRPIAVKVTVAV